MVRSFQAAAIALIVSAGGADALARQQTMDDYPPDALREKREGATRIAGTIGIDGRLTKCRIVESSGSADLDEASCTLLTKRGRWNPARDAQGRLVEAPYTTRINWKISP